MTALSEGRRMVRFPHRLARLFVLLAATVPSALALAQAAPDHGVLVETTPLAGEEYYRVNADAHGLAGMPGPAEGGSAAWQGRPEWLDYQTWMDGRWTYIERVRVNAMRSWTASHLADLQGRPVYYPFSGPDFLYVNTFFPEAKYTVMGGLEPVGTIPDLAALQQQGRLGSYLAQMKTALFTILAASFFKTKDMQSDLHNQLDGLLPIMAAFIARQGYTIDSLRYVTLEHDGTLHPHEAADATGVQITYFQGDRSDAHVLLYLQTDLSDGGLKDNPGYTRLMQRLGPGATYIKAASYLLDEDDFSDIRQAILDDSAAVVQDDSGIPLRYFKPAQWSVTPYGNYTGPLPIFQQYYQPDLAQFYTNRIHELLPFGSGYKYIAADSSLLVARKVGGAAH